MILWGSIIRNYMMYMILIDCIVDNESFEEYKEHYGQTLVVGYAKIGNQRVGIVANQRKPTKTAKRGN